MWHFLILLLSFHRLEVTSDGPIDISEYPFLVSVGFNTVHVCTGAVISERFILTGDFMCTSVLPPEVFYITINQSIITELEYGTPVRQIFHHPLRNWDISTFDYDVSILELGEPLDFGLWLEPANLPDFGYDLPEGSAMVTAGWLDYGAVWVQFATVDVRLIANDDCARLNDFEITNTITCTVCPQKGNETCFDDFGGALVTEDKILFGLFSWQRRDGYEGPAVYARVSGVRDFIFNVTGI